MKVLPPKTIFQKFWEYHHLSYEEYGYINLLNGLDNFNKKYKTKITHEDILNNIKLKKNE